MNADLSKAWTLCVPIWAMIPWLALTAIIAMQVLMMWLPVLVVHAADQRPGASSPAQPYPAGRAGSVS
jgi:hypothetical protein